MSSMAKQAEQRVGLLQETFDVLILRTLYLALPRLEQRGWVSAKWKWLPIEIGKSNITD
jgi:hypothetical protein